MRASMAFWAVVGVASNILLAAVFMLFVLRLPPSAAAWRDLGHLGGALGVLGGLVGACASIFRAKGPRERAFVVKSLWVAWPVLMAFAAVLLALSPPYRFYFWIPWGILVWLGSTHHRRTQRRIRQEESQGHRKA